MNRKFIVAGIITGVLAIGGGAAAYASSTVSDPAVTGGRLCVQYNTNAVTYDYDNYACPAGSYLDQLRVSVTEPAVTVSPAVTATDVVSITIPYQEQLRISGSTDIQLTATSSDGYRIREWAATSSSSDLEVTVSRNGLVNLDPTDVTSIPVTYEVTVWATDDNNVTGETSFPVTVQS